MGLAAGFYKRIPARYLIMIMIFLTTYVNYLTRANISLSLPAMVNLVGGKGKNATTYCEVAEKTKTSEDTGQKFDLDENVQGLIIAAYFHGYFASCLPAGAFAEWVGPSWCILGWTLVAGVFNSVCVWLAPIDWKGLYACRFIIGFAGGFIYPALQTQIGRWAPPQEKIKFTSMLMGNTLGTALAWVVVGVVTKHYKWPWGFHVLTIQIFVYLIIFWIFSYDSPDDHKWITEEELTFIKTSQEGKVSKGKSVAPYKKMLLSFPFWCLNVLHFGNLYGLYVQLTSVPKFMKQFMGFDINSSGIASALPNFCRLFLGFFYGWLGDYFKRKKFRRVIILKSFILLSHIVPGIFMMLMATIGCSSTLGVVFLCLSLSINGAVVVTNLANPTDLSPNFAGTIFGIISFTGGSTGFISPAIGGLILDKMGNTPKAWNLIFIIGGLVYVVCGTFFIIFGSAEIQPWNEKKEEAQAQAAQ